MQISDGEYDIDLLFLGSASPQSSLALRYGFVPDSMDQHASLNLYRNDQVCILEAPLIDKLARSGLKSLPIIFEGIPQQRRPTGNGSSSNLLPPAPGHDSYYLSFIPSKSGNSPFDVLLQPLSNTIRMNKSRNSEKWRTAISEWEHDPHSSLEDNVTSRKLHTESTKREQKKEEAPKPKPRAQSKVPKKPASKRPPTHTPEPDPKEEIISMSDFEDILDSESSKDSISIDSPNKPPTKEGKQQSARLPKKASENRDEDMDDFQDLEDQLQEALEENPNQKGTPAFTTQNGNTGFSADIIFSDSDEDEATPNFRREAIVINMDDGSSDKSRPNRPQTNGNLGKKPMSLHELYGGKQNDDMSSSEEE